MTATIEIENVGPIEHLSIPIPDTGGVVVLRGRNGSGKSHAITGVQALSDTTARKSLTHRDGSREGSIEGLGVRVRLGRSNTARGQLEAQSIDSALDPSVFVDPGMRDPELCDRKRIHALARFCGLQVTREEWLELLKPISEVVLVGSEDLTGDDPIEVSDRLRRKLHDHARSIEKEVAGIQAKADAVGDGIDETCEGPLEDITPLHDAVRRAEVEYQVIARERDQRESMAAKIAKLQERIETSASIDLEPLHVDIAKLMDRNQAISESIAIRDEQLAAARKMVASIEDEIRTLSNQHGEAARQLAEANERLVQAEDHNEEVRKLRESASLSLPEPISDERVVEASSAIAKAREAVEAAVIRNEARSRRDKWQQLVREASDRRAIAERVRDVARSTDSVIEAAFSARGLGDILISQGRPCVKTDRGIEPVSELSHGERWTLALDIVSRGLGEGAVVAINQEAWEALDPDNRATVARLARERHVSILTAEASDGDLRAVSL